MIPKGSIIECQNCKIDLAEVLEDIRTGDIIGPHNASRFIGALSFYPGYRLSCRECREEPFLEKSYDNKTTGIYKVHLKRYGWVFL